MKLITSNLLLILHTICITKCGRQKEQNNITVTNANSIVILGTDGFVGKMQKDVCSQSDQDRQCKNQKRVSSCSWGCNTMFVISFTTNRSQLLINVTDSDPGVSLSNVFQYKLILTRNNDPAIVCLFEGYCKNLTDKVNLMLQNTSCISNGKNGEVKWMHKNNSYVFKENNCTITCLDPKSKCKKANYVQQNCTSDKNLNFIDIQSDSCYKCGSAIKNLSQLSVEVQNPEPDAKQAAKTMENISNLVSLMDLENLTDVYLSMGDVQGVLSKINDVQAVKTSAFIFSSETGLKTLTDMDQQKNYPTTVTIPEEAVEKAFNQSDGKTFLGVFRFPNMTKEEDSSVVLNNEVYAIEMGTKISNLTENIQLSFKHEEDKTEHVCVSWDGSGNNPNWTTDGCNTTDDGNWITCSCCHLTFFAVLMNPVDAPVPDQDLVTLTYITYIGCGLSMFFLGIGLFMHFLLRKAKASNSVHVLINLFVALFLLNLTFLSNEYVAHMNHIGMCRFIAGFMHYCMLASFTWFAVEAFHLCLQMVKPTMTIDHYVTKISVAGWVPPALVVSVIFILGKYGENTIQTNTSNNKTMCWILDSTVHYTVNVGYYSFVFIFTFSTFIVVLRWFCLLKQTRWRKMKHSGTGTSDITTILGLCCLLGLTWSFSFFSYGALRVPSYYIFTILNSFQGFFLFIYYIKSSTLFGDPAPSESSETSEDTRTKNPYVN